MLWVAIAGVFTAALVFAVAFPLIWGTFGPESEVSGSGSFGLQRRRANDLFGYFWVGGPELATVSWPTMLGYSTLVLLLVTIRRWIVRHAFWVLLGLFFGVLSLGKELHIGREATGIPMPYALLAYVPGLSMLRKPDRCFLMVQLVVALLAAEAWIGVRAWLGSAPKRAVAWGAVAMLVMVELTGVPFLRFDYPMKPYTDVLRRDDSVTSVIEIPPMPVDVMNARYNFFQTGHEKKQPTGYCTALALTAKHDQQMQVVVNTYIPWMQQGEPTFAKWVKGRGIDRVVLHKTITLDRPGDPTLDGATFWEPFFFVRRRLVDIRQTGQYLDRALEGPTLFQMKLVATRFFGAAVYEDDDVVIYDARGQG